MDDYRYDEEDEESMMPFEGVDKASAMQQCRCFNSVPLDISACVDAMTQMLYLLSTGTTLTESESTDIFFMSTKLLQSSHPKLRRLHYVLMKELAPKVEQSFIASNSLMIDIKNSNESAKANAIRALYAVMDSSMYNSMDRTIVECMTSRNPNVVTAALVTGIHMTHTNPEMPKKWATQLTEVMRGSSKPQYACIALLHSLRRNDRLSVTRLVEQVKAEQIRAPLAVSLVIKMCRELMQEDFQASVDLYRFVCQSASWYRSDSVTFEAAEAIASLRNVTDKEVQPAVVTLSSYLQSTDPVSRFAAVRQLSNLATTHPGAVAPVNNELETLVLDPSRINATLAITALLKTGTEASIERLINQLSAQSFVKDLGDEFRSVIVDAMRVLNVKFPSKYAVILSFLYKALNDEGSSALKQNVVDTMIEIAKSNPESNERVLTNLAEFIDDCEFPHITKRVLMYLGEEAGSCQYPQRFVRYVNNHATLDPPEIRAVAVSTLAKIAARVPALRRSILVLLRRSCLDTDDEVRDRALLYTKLFVMADEELIHEFIDSVASAVAVQRSARMREKANSIMHAPSHASEVGGVTPGLDGGAAAGNAGSSGAGASPSASVANSPAGYAMTPAILQGRDELRKIKQLRALGEPIKSIDAVPLTDPTNEYVVSVMKHLYAAHAVLQFRVRNTMDEIAFRNITVLTDTSELEAEPLYAIPLEALEPSAAGYTYVVLQYEPEQFPSGSVDCSFRFSTVEAGAAADEPGDEDEFPIESFDVDIHDFIVPANLGGEERTQAAWDELEAEETGGDYALRSMRNLTVAAQELAGFFGMHVLGGVPDKVTTNAHNLFMAGRVADAARTLVLVQARVYVAADNTVALKLAIRGGSAELREYLSDALLS